MRAELAMQIERADIYKKASGLIRELYGPNATFREGQYEAIEATMTRKRTLVVQKTGWGKSLVYFACTKMMREEHRGVTMVISPLLVLMQNQIEAAEKIGLRCDVLNSRVRDREEEIISSLENDELDLILVTPETLFRDAVQNHLKNIRIGLFVIDEAHCISDWGHDFRLDYGNLKKIIAQLPPNVPILATTATANDRVVQDLKQQLGDQVFISRGPLTRDSLSIQVLRMPDKIRRYAWILDYINQLPGSGIIYCLTQRDCDYLSDFLKKNGIHAEAYYSRDGEEGENVNREIEEKFKRNELKAIIATIKLGMGYDKGDISFVIHYQMPQNIVSYYQQIGRAGRNIERAYTFLMFGKEDEDILNYFINTAFPTEEETKKVIGLIADNDGLSKPQISRLINIRNNRLEKVLMFLQHDGFILKDGTKYYITPKPFCYDGKHYEEIRQIRIREMEQMKQFAETKECLSKYVVSCLDDKTAMKCGKCANCLGRGLLPELPSKSAIEAASQYINGLLMPIEPRKMWILSDVTSGKKIEHPNKEGICLSKYGDPGIGELVKRDKYSQEKRFCDELVGKSAEVLRPLVRKQHIEYVCCVPSLRSDIVKEFSMRLADSLGIQFVELLRKTTARQQKEMENSSHQCANAFRSFSAIEEATFPEKVILVDDIVDSKWTMTVCGYRLAEKGCDEVYPFALADSSQKED